MPSQFGGTPVTDSPSAGDSQFGGTPDYSVTGTAAMPKSVGGFLGNIASSTGSLIGNAISAVAHPLKTLDALGAIPVGLAEKAAGAVGLHSDNWQESSKMLDAMVDHLKQRYGSFDNVKQTLYDDPAGVMADLSTVIGGAGAVAKGAGTLADLAGASRAASVAGTAGKVAATVGDAVNPLMLAGRAAVPVAQGMANGLDAALNTPKLAARLYQSAMKPGPGSYSLPEVAQMVETGLTNKLPVSADGVEKLQALVDDLNNKIQATVASNGKSVTIDPNAVAQRVDQIRPKYVNQVNPVRDVKMLDAAQQEFINMQSTPSQPGGILDAHGKPVMTAGNPQPIPAADAQAMKQNTYSQLRSSYGEMKNAQIEAQKALARGIKEELVQAIPELGTLNEKESKLLGLQDALERAVRRVDNHDMMGIGTPIAAGAAGAMTGHGALGVAAGVLKSVLDNPMMKSRLAIALNRADKLSGFTAPTRLPRMAMAIGRIDDYVKSLDLNAAPGQAPVAAQ